MRRLIYVALLLVLVAGFAWALWPRPVGVETAVISRQDIAVHVEEEGKSRIREIFTVSAPIAGRMSRVDLHAGDAVIQGETVVARIRPAAPALLDARARRVAEAARDAAAAAVDLARAQLAQAEAQRTFLRGEADRAAALAARGAVSERAYDKAALDLTAAEAAVESAQASLVVRERELESASAALIVGEAAAEGTDCCTEVRAPATGEVLRVLTESEQVVQPGQPLMEIGDPADIEIEVELLSSDAVRVEPGATATVEGWGGPPLGAEVERIDPSATTKVSALGIEEQRVTAILRLSGENAASSALGDGYRVTVRITVWEGSALVAVPVGALFRSGSSWAAYVVREGRASLSPIEIGQRNSDFAEVRSGLAEGDVVILHPNDQIADGVRVAAAPLSEN